MFSEMEWYDIQCRAFTMIRGNFPVGVLNMMAEDGNETPVCGDTLATKFAKIENAE